MKKFQTMLIVVFLLSLSSLLFAASFDEPVVLYLRAYIPERTTVFATDDGLFIESNAYNFSCSMVEQGWERTIMVVAN